jgi:hypothetical protein
MACLLTGCLFPDYTGNPLAGLSCSEKQEQMRQAQAKTGALATRLPFAKTSSEASADSLFVRPGEPEGVVEWVPPYGYPNEALLPDTGFTQDSDTMTLVPIPDDISLILVATKKAFHADVRIYDYKGERVAGFTEAFGYHGELKNNDRMIPQGRAAYLVWNARDRQGNPVETANYEWDVTIRFEGGHVEKKKAMIGFWGPDCANP